MAVILLGSAGASAAAKKPKAAPAQESEVADVPGDDIFGFTSPTDLGNVGDVGLANENDGRIGKRDGSYFALNSKYELGWTFAKNWWIGGSIFTSYNYAGNVTGIDDIRNYAFDGFSFELAHKIIERSAMNPFAVTLSVEPRFGLIDGGTGLRARSNSVEFKLFTDAVVVKDRVFWGANLTYAPQRAQDPADTSTWLDSSSTLASTALTFQLDPRLFVGGEVRLLHAYDSLTPRSSIGHALFAGPTLLWKVTDKIVFNATYQPQIAGQSITTPETFDLDNFERAQFRAKLSIAFQ